jgi:hypothetical protein
MSNEKGWKLMNYGVVSKGKLEGSLYLQYMEGEQLLGKTFYFLNDSCKTIQFSYLNTRLKKVTKDMNSRLILKGNSIWIDEKEHTRYELVLDQENLGIFNIYKTVYPASN